MVAGAPDGSGKLLLHSGRGCLRAEGGDRFVLFTKGGVGVVS